MENRIYVSVFKMSKSSMTLILCIDIENGVVLKNLSSVVTAEHSQSIFDQHTDSSFPFNTGSYLLVENPGFVYPFDD